ncbi:MAG: hypothetical protein ACFE7E_00465 [Candidatus Hodarchaeota archaeon]
MSENAQRIADFLEKAWEKTSIIASTDDYVYCLSFDPEKSMWTEASYMFKEQDLQIRDLSPEKALLYLIEELTKGISQYTKPLNETIITEKAKLDKLISRIRE